MDMGGIDAPFFGYMVGRMCDRRHGLRWRIIHILGNNTLNGVVMLREVVDRLFRNGYQAATPTTTDVEHVAGTSR